MQRIQTGMPNSPMRKSKTYALGFFAVGVVLTAACAHSSGTSRGETGAAAPQNPAAGTVTATDIERTPAQTLEEIVAARVAGVSLVRTADGGVTLRIRGGSSILGNNQPLFVIDGIPLEPGPKGTLTGIAASDIASIEVLKDVASTAMYGVRGANGVIVIRTKRPNE